MIDLEHLREGRPGCPSDLALDRLTGEELSGDERTRVLEHVDTCDVCRRRVEERRRGFAAFPEVDVAAFARRLDSAPRVEPARPSSRWSTLRRASLAALPLAAALALFWGTRPSAPEPDETARPQPLDPTVEPATGAREKGGLALHVFREVGGRADEVVSGTRLAAGDRIRFTVDLPHAGQVRVLGVEASGALYTAWPMGAGESTALGAGPNQELPGAVALDASHGRETLYVVLCPSTLTTFECTRGGKDPHCPKGCELSPFLMEKP